MINIQEILKENYSYLTHKYGEKSILGVFATGLINYGYAEDGDAKPYELTAIYMPSFEELCLKDPKDIMIGPIRLIDIRIMYGATKNYSYNSLELLCTDGCRYINPLYVGTFEAYLVSKREEIAHYCEYERIVRAETMALEFYQKRDMFNAYRLILSAERFMRGLHIDDCFRFQSDALWEVKRGNVFDYKELDTFARLKIKADTTKHEEIDGVIKNGIIQLMLTALEEKMDFDTFINTLTAKEKQAYDSIWKELNGENGLVSIIKLTEEYGLSRPTYNNLINKMTKAKIAEVQNKGVKGTYIKFN